MCGIFGTIHYEIQDKTSVLRSLAHRGPDEQNFLETGPVTWYHARLAIQDLSPFGRQPMQRGDVFITYNGEIYNHTALREKHSISEPSRSDTATLLALYDKMGMGMLEELDGMFAMAIYDMSRGKVFLARDRAGKKPLYLWHSGNQFVFSSELGALRSALPLEINESALSTYLYMGFFVGKSTPYRQVDEVSPGTWMEIDVPGGNIISQRWFDISRYYLSGVRLSEEEALGDLDKRLHRAVQVRIDSSDLEVGTFLSGGIDSGLVTSIAAQCTRNLKTFTVKLPGAYDESVLAEQVARKYQTTHTTLEISFDGLRDDFTRIVTGYGEPFFDNSAIPSYYVSREAKRYITVALNGDGADELFGGYRRYVPFKRFDFFSANALARSVAGGLSALLPPAHEKKSAYSHVYRLLQFAAGKDLSRMYAMATTDVLAGCETAFLSAPDLTLLAEKLNHISTLPVSGLSKMLLADFESILPGSLLPKMDIATMAHALEGRSPFLGKDMLEFAPSLPDNLKVNGTTTKYLLRKLAARYLPPDLPAQPKRGFEVPLKQWMDNELRELWQAYLLDTPGALYPSFLRPGFIRDLADRKVRVSDEKRARILYALLCMEAWYRHVHLRGARNVAPGALLGS